MVGEIQNISNGTIDRLKVTVLFYNSQKQIIGRDFTYTDPPIVGPGETTRYEILESKDNLGSPDIKYIKLNYQWLQE